MKRTLILLFCAVLVLTGITPAMAQEQSTADNPHLALANLSVINMREDPDYAAELGTQALMGTPLKVYEHKSYWVKVETPDGYKAWVNDMAIVEKTPEELAAWKKSSRLIVTAYYTFFLAEPKNSAAHVSDGVWGCVVQNMGKKGKFFEVKLPDGRMAFVPCKDVQDFETWAKTRTAVIPANASQAQIDKARQAVIETAKTFLGVPYLWAGTSIKGVDCSGFSKTTYFLNGYYLLRNASQQYRTGEPVDVSNGYGNLQPADLVFFGREATADKPERITHVGIYLGDGMLIHSSELVRINNLVDENAPDYYSRKIIRACRVIGNQDCGKDILSVYRTAYFE